MKMYKTLQDEIKGRCFYEGNYPHGWPMHDTCPCCESENIVYHFSKFGIAHWMCKSCKFVFANPYPPDVFLEGLYNGSYMTGVRRYVEIPKARIGRDDSNQAMSKEFYTEIIRYITQRRRSGSWLDVGGGIGSFLFRVKKNFSRFTVYLNEMNAESITFARDFYGLNVLSDLPMALYDRGMRFDIITSLAVLEHLSHPKHVVHDLIDLLRPGGLLFINTPNFTPLCRLISKGASHAVTAPFHLSLFNKENFTKMLKSFDGVDVIDVWDVGPQAFYFMHLARITECHDIQVPDTPCKSLSSIQRILYTPRQERLIPWLSRFDNCKWIQRLIRRFDGGIYLNAAVVKRY